MVATFLDHNKRELKQQREDSNENGKKAIGINKQNNIFARASRFCEHVHFLAVHASLRLEIPNFTHPLNGVGGHSTKNFVFFF